MKHAELLSLDSYEHGGLYNCLGWAMQKINGKYKHEQLDERTTDNLRTAEAAKQHIESSMSAKVEILDRFPNVTELEDNQYFVAVRTSSSGDAHFIRSDLEKGQLVWTQKLGDQGPLVKLLDITPENDEAFYTYEAAPGNESLSGVGLIVKVEKASYVGKTRYLRVTLKDSANQPPCCTVL